MGGGVGGGAAAACSAGGTGVGAAAGAAAGSAATVVNGTEGGAGIPLLLMKEGALCAVFGIEDGTGGGAPPWGSGAGASSVWG